MKYDVKELNDFVNGLTLLKVDDRYGQIAMFFENDKIVLFSTNDVNNNKNYVNRLLNKKIAFESIRYSMSYKEFIIKVLYNRFDYWEKEPLRIKGSYLKWDLICKK